MQLVIDRFGRVVLPKAVRDGLGLLPGDVLDLDERAEGVVLRPVRDVGLIREKDGLLVYTGKASGDLRSAVAEHRQARLQHASGLRKRP